mgnify:CR=1 FL=1
MASLPVTLTYGMVSVYGAGYSGWGIIQIATDSTVRFGTIDQITSAPAELAIGANVMYNYNDVVAPVMYAYNEFNILPWNKIIAIEFPNPIS